MALLQTDKNKFILTRKELFMAVGKHTVSDYVIELGAWRSLFFSYLLKKDEKRELYNERLRAAVTA